MNAAMMVAGSLAVLAAAVHGYAGELLVVRRLSREMLPSTRFGGSGMTRAMIHVTWHLTTLGFLTVGSALLVSGTVLDGDEARAVAVVAAAGATGFALLIVGLGTVSSGSLRTLYRHPAGAVLSASAALAWLGAL